jgi:hypothetical protein
MRGSGRVMVVFRPRTRNWPSWRAGIWFSPVEAENDGTRWTVHGGSRGAVQGRVRALIDFGAVWVDGKSAGGCPRR